MDADMAASKNGLLAFLAVVLVCIFVWLVWQNWLKPKSWLGMYELPSTNAIQTESFGSREECEDWMDEISSNPNGAYNIECGSNCKAPATELGFYRCEETF